MRGTRIPSALVMAAAMLAIPSPAAAYVGPGAALAAIGAALAFLAALGLAVGGFIWYPVKRLYRFVRGKREPGTD